MPFSIRGFCVTAALTALSVTILTAVDDGAPTTRPQLRRVVGAPLGVSDRPRSEAVRIIDLGRSRPRDPIAAPATATRPRGTV